jgi:hypothetical protein
MAVKLYTVNIAMYIKVQLKFTCLAPFLRLSVYDIFTAKRDVTCSSPIMLDTL